MLIAILILLLRLLRASRCFFATSELRYRVPSGVHDDHPRALQLLWLAAAYVWHARLQATYRMLNVYDRRIERVQANQRFSAPVASGTIIRGTNACILNPTGDSQVCD